jgi:hypothetical protein
MAVRDEVTQARYAANYLAQQAMERSRSVATKPSGAGAEDD